MRKLLFISYFFPPIQTVESTISLNTVKYLAELGWKPIVICAIKSRGLKNDEALLSAIPKNIEVHRVFSWEWSIFKVLYSLKLIPDPQIGWFLFAFREAKKILKTQKIDIIFSRANPITSHLVSLRLKKLFNIPVVGWFSDPWTQNPYIRFPNNAIRKLNEFLENKIITKLDGMTVTNEQTRRLFLKKYDIGEKTIIIPNSYDEEEFKSLFKKYGKIGKNLQEKRMVITHTGTFYNLRSPEPFLKALRALLDEKPGVGNRILARFIGSLSEFSHLIPFYKLESVVEVISYIPREEALVEMFKTDLLLLIDAPAYPESVFLPVKTLEYIRIKKPILAITPKGAVADIIESTKTGIVVSPTDIVQIKDAIAKYYDLYRSSKLKISPNQEVIESYSAENCAKKLGLFLEKICQKKK